MNLPSQDEWNGLTSGKIAVWGKAPTAPALFSGSFNPLHDGHRQMVALATDRLKRKVHLEISLANVDKPDIDLDAICQRVSNAQSLAPVLLTRSPRFVEKAMLFPGATFIVGADTALRLDDPRYYDDQSSLRDQAFETIQELGCRFVVFGRKVDKTFYAANTLPLSEHLSALCDFVPAVDFRVDISSTQLRRS